jgi:CxxC-x17-CxxC domain-containing protein
MSEINFFAETTYRNDLKKFGIKIDDRRRHFYVVGKTGMGKTAMLQNMAIQDIQAGKGVGFVDPHGEVAEALLNFIPSDRVNDVVYFNPADLNYPIAFNVMEKVKLEHRHLVAGGLMGVFKKIWPDVWSARMEYILNNTILALLEYPGSTLLGVNRMLSDAEFRKQIVEKVTDPVIKSFWVNEFANYNQRYETEATAAIQNKVGQFVSAPLIRNIIGQVKSTINMRDIMDEKKILILNLSKGRIGEDNSMLLGALLITKIQLAAMSRVDILEEDRQDFFLYVDEFQNFATESFANILSEARKYRLDLILAHQYISQMEDQVRDAVFGNVGTLVSFRVGADDAEFLEKEFFPQFMATDLVNLAKYDIYLKLMIDGIAGRPFSAHTLNPFPDLLEGSNREKIIKASRERYATLREKVEEKIIKWTGFSEQENSKIETKKTPVLYDAVCSVCGKPTKTVFLPDGKRPVYCKACLKKSRTTQEADKRDSVKENQESISLEEAIQREPISFRESNAISKARVKKRKPVDLEGLKETLQETLNKFKQEEDV